MPHITNRAKLPLIFTLTILLALVLAGTAAAHHEKSNKPTCLYFGGSWSGPNNGNGTCTYLPGSDGHSNAFIQNTIPGGCPDTHKIVQTVVNGDVQPKVDPRPACIPLVSPFSAQGGKCKLTDIDNPIRRGAPGVFEASWVGTLESIKFFSNAEGNNGGSVAPIAGSVSKSGNVSTGLFAGPSVDAGRYFALCFGPGGSGGGSIGGIQVTP